MTQAPAPDPMKGIRGVFAMTLVLEAIVVGLALLVLPKFGGAPSGAAFGLIGGLAVAMVVASGLQRRSWGLAVALVLQVAVIVAGFVLVPALGVMGLVFAAVWLFLLWLRREVTRRMAAGQLPAQQVPEP
ncbi:DUF4233 domain-containing protein [Pseudonocardia sp. CA-107938]|uniref:DUF4233 domain-containing protein n=1 Tax=Pseudonocardia sp. CA-107938 TaxID=3240021 RepID=UPI003D8FF074